MGVLKQETAENQFFNLFKKIAPGIIDKDYMGYPCVALDVDFIKNNDYKQLLFEYCYIPYEEEYFKYWDAGYKIFAEFVALWHYFFRDLKVIDSIIETDTNFRFADALFADGMFAIFGSRDDSNLSYEKFLKKYKNKIEFSFYTTPWQYNQIDYLMKKFSYDENIVRQIIVDILLKNRKVKVCTKSFSNKYKFVSEFDSFYEQMPSANSRIAYSKYEEALEWKDGEFQINLPKTIGDIYNLNHVLFRPTHGDLDNSVIEKVSTEVYLKKGTQYRLLIELEETDCCFIMKSAWLPGNAWYGINRYEYDFIMHWCDEKCIMIDWDRCALNDFVH